MNDETLKNNPDTELSPEVDAAMHRLLSDVSERDNSGVDYERILGDIKRKAASENIVVFPSAKTAKKRRNLARFAAVAAAAFLMIGAASLVASHMLNKENNYSASMDAAVSNPPESAKIDDKQASAFTPIPTSVITNAPEEHNYEINTEAAFAVATEPVIISEMPTDEPIEFSPFPTEFPTRDGVAGYVEIEAPESEPLEPSELIPSELPEFMDVKESTDPFEAFAYGNSDDEEYCYTCQMLHDIDAELDIGVAQYNINDFSGTISYLWRISEDTFLYVEFTGFDRERTEGILASLFESDESSESTQINE